MSTLTLGLSTTVIGMLVVFFGLIVLIALIYCMTALTSRMGNKEQAAKQPAAEQPEEEIVEEAVEEEDDGELIAVISAAIAAVWNKPESGFVVRRVKRYQNSPAWQRNARDEQMYSHM